MTHIRLIALVALYATMVGAGCSRRAQPVTRVEPPPPTVAEEATPPPSDPAAPPATTLTEEELFARKTLEELNAERPLGDVFFDLDQSVVREDARAVLQKNAAWLQRWTSTRITINGHGDERGTSEYNLALGAQRANAAQDYLLSLGVSRDRIDVVSKGEESPFCTDQHEGCWQLNRRGHFILTAK